MAPVSATGFFTDEAKQRIGACVRAIEADTRAEIVVAVRPRVPGLESWDLLAGVAVAYLGLLAFLYLPTPFALWLFAVGVPLLFIAAWQAMRAFASLRMLVVPRSRLRARAVEAARSTFQELGVRSTRERNGMLVLLSPNERMVVALADDGLAKIVTPQDIANLEQSLDGDAELDAFISALERLGERLGAHHPRGDKSDNELEEVA